MDGWDDRWGETASLQLPSIKPQVLSLHQLRLLPVSTLNVFYFTSLHFLS